LRCEFAERCIRFRLIAGYDRPERINDIHDDSSSGI
jgi:hypothetical protein